MSILKEAEKKLIPLTTLLDLLTWYKRNLCGTEIYDPRGHRVRFLETDFIHLIKLVNKYGEEPRNTRLAIEEIERERIKFVAGRFDPRRAQELCIARDIATQPTRIVPNWQPLGRANPGEAYIKNLGTEEQPIYRVLVCGIEGKVRRPVTIFPREEFSAKHLAGQLWP
jgi:hypothetical protein